jgi:hypothetical protein
VATRSPSGPRLRRARQAWEPAHKALPSRRFVSGSKDMTVRVWDATTRRCLFTMSSHTMVGGTQGRGSGRRARACAVESGGSRLLWLLVAPHPALALPAHPNYPPQPRAQVITQVKWGGEGLIYSASRDCSINVWDADGGKLVRTLKGHAHWVNTLALSSEYALRTGAHDHRGSAPADVDEARAVRLPRGPARRGRGRGAGWGAGAVKRGAPCPLAVRPTHPLDHLAPTAPQKNRPPRSGTTRRPAAAPSAWSAAATTSRCFCGRLLLVRPTSRG